MIEGGEDARTDSIWVYSSCFIYILCILGCFNILGFPGGSVVKNLPANAGDAEDVGSLPGLKRSLGGGNGNPL